MTPPFCRFHCRMCDLHFVSLEAFDAHIGPPGHHHEPVERPKLRVRARDAICRMGAEPVSGVVLWENARQTDRTRRSHGRAKGRGAPREAT